MNTIKHNEQADIFSLLLRRGFLLDDNQGAYILSDNAHPHDAAYLDEVLKKYQIGHMSGNGLCIEHPENGHDLMNLFEPSAPIGNEISWSTQYDWSAFARFEYGKKAPVAVLEPNVAFYCKALSACGLDTVSSCDGNHKRNHTKLFVSFQSPSYTFWHQLLWQQLLAERFQLAWQNNYLEIQLDDSSRNQIYDELFRAAGFLYSNMQTFRLLKQQSAAMIKKSYIWHSTDEQIMEAVTACMRDSLNKISWQ